MIIRFFFVLFCIFFNFQKICRDKDKKKDKLRISALYQLNNNHASVIYGLLKTF